MSATALSDSQLLARLIAFDSTSVRSNLPIADFICDYLDDPRIRILRYPSEDLQKVNLVIGVGLGGGENVTRDGLILSGHMDVVPATEPEWRSDPFTMTEAGETYVGRGVADMKGFVALAVNIARAAVDHSLRVPLVLMLTYDEEVGLVGAQRLVQTWDAPFALPRSAIIGEPTSLRLVRMHKGYTQMRVTCVGQSAHSAYAHLGKNAIEPAARIVRAMSELASELAKERSETSEFFPQTPFVSLTVAGIRGGVAFNVVPDRCEVDLSFRVLPDMNEAEIVARIRQRIESIPDRGDCSIEVLHGNPPLLLPKESITNRRLGDILGQDGCMGVSYATDAGVLQRLDLECAIYGPGSIEVAHKPNESLPKKEFTKARQELDRVVEGFCK